MHPFTPLHLYKLRRSQWLAEDDLARLQWRRLRRIIRHCYDSVPYYRSLFQSIGLKPDDVRGMSDLALIPITTKDALQQASPHELFADGRRPARSIERRTSGTTGRPVSIVLKPSERAAQDVVQARALVENGLRLRDMRAVFVAPWQIPDRNRWFQRLGVWRKAYFSVFDDIREQIPALERLSPDSLAGTPAVLKLIALEKLKNGSRISPRTVFSTADLLDQSTRRLLESAFDVRVTDIYGSLEFECIAWECPHHSGYHINMEGVVLEFLDNDVRPVSPGEAGEVVCTSLLSYAMPFLRYRLGDICSPSDRPCPCGRGLPLIELVQGRANDAIRLSDGRVVTPQAVADAMVMHGRMIEEFRIVQESEDLVSVHLTKGADFGEETVPLAEKGLREALGGGVRLAFSVVGHIDRDSSGKQRAIVSKVSER